MKNLSDYNFFDPELLVCPYEFYKLAQEQAPLMELPSPKDNTKLFLVIPAYSLAIFLLYWQAKKNSMTSYSKSMLKAGQR
jgi:hypothetical protein